MSTPQFVEARRQTATKLGLAIGEKAATRGVQHRLRQLVDAGILRRIAQPVFRDDHTGSKPYVYTLSRTGALALSADHDLKLDEIDWRSQAADGKPSFLFLDHTLAIGDFYLALTRACLAYDVTLAQWTSDRILRRRPARVPVALENGRLATVALVPDAFYQLVLPSQQAAWLFLEMDLGSMTIAPNHGQLRAWRRKFLAYQSLAESGVLRTHYGANSMIVTTVTTSPARVAHLVAACERAGCDRRFWFTTADQMHDLFGAIWRVAGRGEALYPLLPQR